MNIQRRNPLSLIEISIAAGLISIILYVLFSAFSHSSFYAKKISEVKPRVLEDQMLYQRCLQIFSFIEPNAKSSQNRLDFTFENHLDPELIYSGKVEANISLEKEDLVLQITSHDKQQTRTEILQKKVTKVHFDTAIPSVLVMKIQPKSRSEVPYAFFLPKENHQGLMVKTENKR